MPVGTMLLEASAGTGKTHAITTLVLRLVAEHAVAIDRLVVVTFTRAAAAELRGRVRSRLSAAIDALDDLRDGRITLAELDATDRAIGRIARRHRGDTDHDVACVSERREALRAAREAFDEAAIDTIHAFCQRILQQVGPEIGADPGGELVEDLTDVAREVVDDLLVRRLRDTADDWYRCLRDAGVTADVITRLVTDVAGARVAIVPDRDERPMDSERAEHVWRERVDAFRDAWRRDEHALNSWFDQARSLGAFGRTRTYHGPNHEARLALLSAWCDTDPGIADLDDIDDALVHVTRAAIRTKLADGHDVAEGLEVVDAAQRLLDTPGELVEQFVVDVVSDAITELDRRKASAGSWSFDDVLDSVERALQDPVAGPRVRVAVRERFDAALIDEFQDTDPVQWGIFSRLFDDEKARLYLVGDPKQAIYSFRGADVRTYLDAAASVPDGASFTLGINHRSDLRLVDALERLFRQRIGDDGVFAADGIEHTPVRAHDDHHADRLVHPDGGRPALHLRVVTRAAAGLGESATITKQWARAHLPRQVASEIVAFLTAGYRLHERDGGERDVRPGDVAVLTRTNEQASLQRAALAALDVPAVVATGQSVLATPEAAELARLLEALADPTDERAVRTALAGGIIGLNAGQLAAFDDNDTAGFEHHVQRMARWAGHWREHGIAAALRRLFTEAGAVARLVTHPRGERALTNLMHLTEVLERAERAGHLGADGLLAWLREARREPRTGDELLELRLESDSDAVQIATIHRAKGLQYPVVWCPFLWDSGPRPGGRGRAVAFHDPQSGARMLDLHADDRRPPRREHIALATRERWEEEIRLLYVALTRAQHRCVVATGPFTDAGSSALHRVLYGATLERDGDRHVARPDPVRWTDAQLVEHLVDRFAGDSIGVVRVDEIQRGASWQAPSHTERQLSARRLTRALDRTWQRTSFTRLTSQGPTTDGVEDHEDDGRDLDHAVASDDTTASAVVPVAHTRTTGGPTVRLPLATLERGPSAGTAVHAIFEHLDVERLSDNSYVDTLIASHLGAGRGDAVDLREGIVAAATTTWGAPVGEHALADIAPADRLDELRFDLPIAGGHRTAGRALTLEAIAEVLAHHAPDAGHPHALAAQRLSARPPAEVRGFLTGSIDLVARVDGGYLLADYKSNWLGVADPGGFAAESPLPLTLDDYHPQRLADEMVRHDYLLQALLYTVALHRLLRWRLGDDYDYTRDVRGFAYLFLRGMTGPDAPRLDDGGAYGVYADKFPFEVVDDVDALLNGETS